MLALPAGNLMPVSGRAIRRRTCSFSVRADALGDRGGRGLLRAAGGALMKSFKRLNIDPLAVYGTLF